MILVTGATGFLGSEVIRQLLKQNVAIRAVKRKASVIPSILKNARIGWRDADILDYFDMEDALEDVTQVYHCAATISFKPSDRKAMLTFNTAATENLVNLCLEKNIRLVHVSSVAALGDSKNGSPITEKDQWHYTSRQSAYSISKYQSEMEVWRGIAEGLDAVIVNPSIIVGRNCTTGSAAFFKTVKQGLRFYPAGSCGLVNVEDVAACMITLMNSDITAERFIINAENWTYENLFKEIAAQYHVTIPSVAVKPWMLSLAASLAKIASLLTGKEFNLTPDAARSASKQRKYDNTKIKEAISVNFRPIKQTISEVCNQASSE